MIASLYQRSSITALTANGVIPSAEEREESPAQVRRGFLAVFAARNDTTKNIQSLAPFESAAGFGRYVPARHADSAARNSWRRAMRSGRRSADREPETVCPSRPPALRDRGRSSPPACC